MKISLTLGLVLLTVGTAAVVVPVANLQKWTSLSYRNIPTNTASVTDGGLHIAVNKFDAPVTARSLHVKARATESPYGVRCRGRL